MTHVGWKNRVRRLIPYAELLGRVRYSVMVKWWWLGDKATRQQSSLALCCVGASRRKKKIMDSLSDNPRLKRDREERRANK